METSDLGAKAKQRLGRFFFLLLLAQPGFSNALLRNRNIEGMDQLSCGLKYCRSFMQQRKEMEKDPPPPPKMHPVK